MKLIDILVQDLPGLGGWPKDKTVASHGPNNCVMFHELGVTPFVYAGLKFEGNDIVTKEEYEAALAASKTEWDGVGLPPVGSNVEARFEGEWVEVTVAYCDCPKPKWDAPVKWDASVWSEALVFNRITTRPFWADEFRPIRSEEEKKRDEAIAALKQFKPQLVGELAGYLYDDIAAGKIPHIRID